MCWPYTLIYGCMDCFAEQKPPADCCIIVAPDAEDPVIGGYNHEGSLCPIRYVGPQASGSPITPMTCPSLSFHKCADAGTAKALPGNESKSCDTNPFAYGTPQLRFWICPRHRPKYLEALGPNFAGYKLAQRIQLVEDQREEIAKEKQRHEIAKGKQKERWNKVFSVVSDPQPRLDPKRKRGAGIIEKAKTTAGEAAAACSLSDLIDCYQYQEQKRRR